jgi:hypothetical protein
MTTERLCVFCEHWEFDGSDLLCGNETAPAEPGEMACRMGHYRIWLGLMDTAQFRETILKARDCPDYQQV